MGYDYDDARSEYRQVHHEGKLSHELIAGAASFGAMKLFEDRQRKQGKPIKHSLAKEVIAGLVGAEVDKLIETKGADAVDKHQTKKHAEEKSHELYEQQYGRYDEYDPNRHEKHEYMKDEHHHERRDEEEHHHHHHHRRDDDENLAF